VLAARQQKNPLLKDGVPSADSAAQLRPQINSPLQQVEFLETPFGVVDVLRSVVTESVFVEAIS
jgi:hypothetical protein